MLLYQQWEMSSFLNVSMKYPIRELSIRTIEHSIKHIMYKWSNEYNERHL